MDNTLSFWRPFASISGLIETACFLALAGTWLGSLGSLHWLLDLFSHFRLQYIILCTLVLIWALWRRKRSLGLVAVASLLANAWPVFQAHHTGEPGEGNLKLMTFNVFCGHPEPARVIEHVLNADADIVCLLETDSNWDKHLQPLRNKYPHHAEQLEYGAFGMACFTRLPVRKLTTRYFAHEGFPSLVMELERDGKPLTVIATHPPPPMTLQTATIWQRQFIEIAKFVSTIPHDLILAGDLNATPWCHGTRLLLKASGLQFRSADPVWQPTWGLETILMIPIDHVLVKGDLSITQRTIGHEVGSDHRSVIVQLRDQGDPP